MAHNVTLKELFCFLNDTAAGNNYFDDAVEFALESGKEELRNYRAADKTDFDLINFNFKNLKEKEPQIFSIAKKFCNISSQAYAVFIHSWMSELPIENKIVNFGKKIIAIADNADENSSNSCKARKAALQSVFDRGDSDTAAVLDASYKVTSEIHRLMGFLRFSPVSNSLYAAKCVPDYFTLPALASHFTARFGSAHWAVLDEKRSVVLLRIENKPAEFMHLVDLPEDLASCFTSNQKTNNFSVFQKTAGIAPSADEWEELWVNYHTSVNNESRSNPNLQKQFMPKRYWKYMPEMRGASHRMDN